MNAIKTELVDGVLRFPGNEPVKRFPGYVPKYVDLDEFSAAFERLSDSGQQDLIDYASKFHLTEEMLRHSEQIFSAYLGKKLSQETEEFLKSDPESKD